MTGRDNVQSLLALRKLTRAITETVRSQMTAHLAALTPLFKPATVLGDYVQKGQREPSLKTEKAIKQLQSLYEAVATARPFNLPRELTPPLPIGGDALEITPHDYSYAIESDGRPRAIAVRAPMTWTLTYSGFGPGRLQELLNTKTRTTDEVLKYVLSYLALHVVLTNQSGLLAVLEALRFPVTTARVPEFGDLPLTRIGPTIATVRPADAVIIESAELTGMDAFEEVVRVEDLANVADPFRQRLLEITQQHLPEVVAR